MANVSIFGDRFFASWFSVLKKPPSDPENAPGRHGKGTWLKLQFPASLKYSDQFLDRLSLTAVRPASEKMP